MKIIDFDPYIFPALDSELERKFAKSLVKHLDESCEIFPQHEVQTLWGRFKIDFALESCGRTFGIECDGKDFHEAGRDEWRDSMILGSSDVAVIYRFRGSDLTYQADDCLYLLSLWEPGVFSERGKINLRTLASEHAKRDWEYANNRGASIHYPPEGSVHAPTVRISRHSFEKSKAGRCHYSYLFDLAKSAGPCSLMELIEKHRLAD
jgi:hypothetical protein